MKHSVDKPGFQPVTFTITCETKKELDVFGSLFNCGPIASALRELGLSQTIWEDAEAAGANSSAFTEEIRRILA